MNWIKVSDQMPPLVEGEAFTKTVFIWVAEEWEREERGFADSGHYSKTWGGWIADQGTLEEQGMKVTHWAEIEPPAFEGDSAMEGIEE